MARRARITREAVLAAAIQIADAEGSEAVTIAAVSKALGIKPPSLYNHIGSLDELRTMVAVHTLQDLYTKLAEKIHGLSGKDAVLAFSHGFMSYAREHPGLYETAQILPNPRGTELEQASEQIVHLSLEMLGPYHLPEEQGIHVVRGLRSLIHGFISLERASGFGIPLEVKDSFEYNLHLLFAGLEAQVNKG
ncbi:WHG domain-containing protein [Paenibacillus sp. D2_2]|uniref:TetR/AcrR family transcriptional regulator n=1 Tax=Paenibacillus sp. D2_2 TaxID=3073092 RepID=UPI002815BBA3|nr:WHG domain-containing protein [Paenibacillus sp. D2_2]WMT40384.1 WHG domain-containing protein [Paenibacillus sp. D2_2]